MCISARKGLQMVYGCVAWVCIARINSKGSWDKIRRRNPGIWDALQQAQSLYTHLIFMNLILIRSDFCWTYVEYGWIPQEKQLPEDEGRKDDGACDWSG